MFKSYHIKAIKYLESLDGHYWPQPRDLDAQWQENADKLKTFVNKYNRLPSFRTKDSEEKKIGSWASHQRRNYKGSGNRTLTREQIAFLESIPGWYWEKDLDGLWQEYANNLKAFVDKRKRLPNFRSKDSEEKKIGKWMHHQRQNYKGSGKRTLTQEQIAFLESIPGWYWDVDELWQENANNLKAFVKKYNRLPISNSKDSEEKKIGNWMYLQRRNYKGKGSRVLTQEQIAFLESIPGWKWSG